MVSTSRHHACCQKRRRAAGCAPSANSFCHNPKFRYLEWMRPKLRNIGNFGPSVLRRLLIPPVCLRVRS
jgi:hypothetical protein